jgi:protein translocase SecG subunit
MTLLIAFLTFILVMNCLFLMLLILIQLPKKEAGAGIAFGGAATDALFGAGSGNALTQMTKYSGTLFVCLAVLLSVLNMKAARSGSRRLEQELSKQAQASAPAPVPSALPVKTPDFQPLTTSNAATDFKSSAASATNSAANRVTTPAPTTPTPAPTAEAPVATPPK